MQHPNLMRLGAIALLAACTGCPGSLDDPGRFFVNSSPGNCTDVPQTIFLPVCATALCHSAKDKTQGLDLQSTDVASRLVGAPSTEGPGLLVDPSSPESSVLYTKVTASPPFGVRMPFNAPPLDDASVACVLQWITEQIDGGASDASTDTDATIGDGTVGSDEASTGGDDGAGDDDSSPSGGDDAAPQDSSVPIHDAGSPHDAQTTHPPDASTHDAGLLDAGAPADAGAE